MRNHILVLLSVLICITASMFATSAEPLLEKIDVFVSGLDGHNIYRIPALIVTHNGTLLAFCEGRSGDDGSLTDMVLKRSHDNGLTWSPMQTVLKGNNEAWMNACPLVDRSDGTLYLVCYHVFKADENKHIGNPFNTANSIVVLKSTDDGLTWSEPLDITKSVGLVVPGPGVGIQLTSGRFIIPCYTKDSRSLVIFSDDHGRTWSAGNTVKESTNECQAVERADGSLMLNMRPYNTKKYRYVAISRDDGLTWEKEYYDTALLDSENQASLLRYTKKEDGHTKNRILFANTAHATKRKMMTVRVSYDEAETWPVLEVVYTGPAAYSCLTVLPDKTIGLLYETGELYYKDEIAFTRFNCEWLTDGGDSVTLK